jgi:hypothetical protein
MVAVVPGDRVSAEITGLGPIAVSFEPEKAEREPATIEQETA